MPRTLFPPVLLVFRHSLVKETGGPPKFPSYPFEYMPQGFDPGGVRSANHSACRLLSSEKFTSLTFPGYLRFIHITTTQ